MKIIECSISENHRIYCPCTDETLLEPGHNGILSKPAAIIGHWLDEDMNEPFIKNKDLQAAWEKYYNDYLDKEDDELHPLDVLIGFLEDYNNPAWKVFQLTERGMACGPTFHTAWLVVPADTIVEEVAETEQAD
jgi:hypothetical protein